MSKFPRRGHLRKTPNNRTTWVRPHTVDRSIDPPPSTWLPPNELIQHQNQTTETNTERTIVVHPSDGRLYLVNPNASCPVCGADVFFYRSPHDGRVFFDELGPPWSKHPCTISNDKKVTGPFKSTRKATSWEQDGWNYISAPQLNNTGSLTELRGYSKGSKIAFYFAPDKRIEKLKDSHIHFKVNRNEIDISIYSFSKGLLEIKAYSQIRKLLIHRLATSIQGIKNRRSRQQESFRE